MDRALVGVAEIAKLSGVTPQAVTNWRRRHADFPEPLAELKSGPVWWNIDIVRWLKERKKS